MKTSLRRGFTLIEMLVTVSIVSFMLLMMVQMTGLAEKAWHLEQDRIDNFGKARAMVDMFTDDLQRAVYRGDLPIFASGAPSTTGTLTNNGLYYFTASTSTISPTSTFTATFYTRLPGVPSSPSTAVRDVSLVSYALGTETEGTKNVVVLQRSDLAVPWSSNQNIPFQGNIATVLGGSQVTAREVAPGVVGFHIAFRLADGTMIDQSQYSGYNSANPTVAIDVAVAVLGKQSLVQPWTDPSTTQMTALMKVFRDPLVFTPGNPTSIKANWDQTVLTAAFYANYPKEVGSSLKTFERWVACPSF
jgi:prepilin-type N-terminal cleavage/methylation domain-containing protein